MEMNLASVPRAGLIRRYNDRKLQLGLMSGSHWIRT